MRRAVSPRLVAPLALSLALALLACSDREGEIDAGPGPEQGIGDGAGRDGPGRDGVRPRDGTKPADKRTIDGPAPDGSTPSKLPPPPAGAVLLRISVDDTTDKAYVGQELVLKGSFAFDEKTYVVSYSSSWAGPWVPLYDDGPAGLEGPGSVAGDHKLGAVVYVVPSAATTFDYGLESPAGWMWPDGQNQKVTVSPGDTLKDLTSFKLAPRAGIDVTWVVDSKSLSGRTVNAGYETVVVRGNATHWAPLLCNDEGKLGDATSSDGKHTCRLSAQIGKNKLFPHLGLPRPGDKVRFYVDIGGSGYSSTAGISATLTTGAGSSAAAITKVGSDLTFTVPSSATTIAAPAPDSSPLPAGKRGDLPGGQLALPASGIKGYFVVPGSYDAHHALPLLVALHGAYENGQWMVNVWKTLAEERGLILLAPSSSGQSWDVKAVFAGTTPVEDQPLRGAITYLQGRYAILPGQIGVEGFSDGASMALYMGLTHGKTFCVAMANSPGGMGKNYPLPDKPAIYITHGDADTVLPVSNARWIKNTLLSYGYKVSYFEFPGVGHVFPTDHKIPMLRYFDENAR